MRCKAGGVALCRCQCPSLIRRSRLRQLPSCQPLRLAACCYALDRSDSSLTPSAIPMAASFASLRCAMAFSSAHLPRISLISDAVNIRGRCLHQANLYTERFAFSAEWVGQCRARGVYVMLCCVQCSDSAVDDCGKR